MMKEDVKHNLVPPIQWIKTSHPYHLVDPSPWPFTSALSAFMTATGLVLFMHKSLGGYELIKIGISGIIFCMGVWWRDIIRESLLENAHSSAVKNGLRLGMLLFIISETMIFFALFWAFFHSSIAPTHNIGGVWPPKAITPVNTFTLPLVNTAILLTSASSLSSSYHAIKAGGKKSALSALILTLVLAVSFTELQHQEYINASFNISDGIFGSCFYSTTGSHGLHVFFGTVALFVALVRIVLNHFTTRSHLGFEFAIWYWHFVDVIWIVLFVSVYWWSSK